MKIEVRIDHIVLDGLGVQAQDCTAIRDEIGSELARSISAGPPAVWRQTRWTGRIRGEAIRLTSDGRWATEAARAVYAALMTELGGRP